MKTNTPIRINTHCTPRCARIACALAVGVGLLSLGVPVVSAATILDSAEALYKLDFANTGTVANATDITDSSGNGHTASSISGGSNLTWTSVPATGPTGGPSVGSPANSGIDLAQPAHGDPGHAGFQVNELGLSGSQAVMARVYWEGNTGTSSVNWIANVNYNTEGRGFLFGIQTLDPETDPKTVLRIGTTEITGSGGSGQQNILATTLKLDLNTWYDIGVSWDDQGTQTTSDDTLSFYLGSEAHGIQSQTFTDIVMPVSGQTHARVGGEGFNNTSKVFNGKLDYAAIFDQAVTEAEFSGGTIPEPSSLTLLGVAGLLAMTLRNRRART